MLKVSKEFEEARNQRFKEKEKVYGGDDNPKNHKNMTLLQIMERIINQADIIASIDIKYNPDLLKKELIDTANLSELAWRKLR